MIRFQRIGRKNDPAFRIAVLEKTAGPKAGKYVDLVGTYNPKTKAVTLAPERIQDWIKKGAQVSPSLHNLLVAKGVVDGKKINVLPKKTPPVKEVVAEEAPAAAVAEVTPTEEAAIVEEAVAAADEVPAEEVASEEAPAA